MDLVFILKWVKSVIGCELCILHLSDLLKVITMTRQQNETTTWCCDVDPSRAKIGIGFALRFPHAYCPDEEIIIHLKQKCTVRALDSHFT